MKATDPGGRGSGRDGSDSPLNGFGQMLVLLRGLSVFAALVCFSIPAAAVTRLANPPDAALVSAAESAFELYPGVVVDPNNEAVYLMSPEGEVERVSLADGEVIWSTTAAAKPLALYGDLLMAQADRADGENVLDIVLLDTRSGGQRRAYLPINLPTDVPGGVDEQLGHSLLVRAQIRAGLPLVTWEHTKSWVKGATPEPGEGLVQKQGAGYQVDFTTGSVTALDGAAIASYKPAVPAGVEAWRRSNQPSIPVVRVDGGLLATTHVQPGSESISLMRWNAASGAPLPEVDLFTGPHILQFTSSDGRHLLVSERANPGEFNEYDWSIFSLETGLKLGQISHHRSHAWFHVSGDNLLYIEQPHGRRQGLSWVEEPLQVKAVDLVGGEALWTRSLRDTTFTGPYPP